MPDVRFMLNGRPVSAPADVSVAVAVLGNGVETFRRSVTGEPRAPLCGMGVCFECRLSIDGRSQQQSCMISLRDGMTVVTDE